jgi:hypothetical protein
MPNPGTRESRTAKNRNPKSQETAAQPTISCDFDHFTVPEITAYSIGSGFFTVDSHTLVAAAALFAFLSSAFQGPL